MSELQDAVQQDVAVLDLARAHLAGRHAEVFVESCIECDRYRLTVLLDEARRELERLHGATVLVQCEDPEHAEADRLRAQRDQAIAATYWEDGEDRYEVPAHEIRDIFSEEVELNG